VSAVELRGVVKFFGTTPVLRSVDLAVPEGSITAVLGASGSGKTTVLRIVAGLEGVDAGWVTIGTTVVDDGQQRVRPQLRGVGYVPQEGALFPHLTVERNVAFGLRRSGRARGRRVHDLLELVGLGGLERRYPHQLSGGQQQRVALARALAIGPAVVLLDEPFSSLDAALRSGLRRDVAAVLRETGTTALLVTHDQDEALAMADQVAILREGRVLAAAEPRDLYGAPDLLATATSVGQANVLDAVVAGTSARTCLGEVTVVEHAGSPQGPARILLRPEQLVLHDEPRPGTARATVRATQFHGHDALVELCMEQPERGELLARVPGERVVRAGTAVWVEVRGAARAWSREGHEAADEGAPGEGAGGLVTPTGLWRQPRQASGPTPHRNHDGGGTEPSRPPRRNWRRVGALLGIVAAVVAAVVVTLVVRGGPNNASAVGPVVFHAVVRTTGRVRMTDPFTDRSTAKGVRSCARAAQSGDQPSMGPRTWSVPTPPITNTVEIEVGTVADGYHGPGRYPRADFAQGYGVMGIGQEDYNLASSYAAMSMTVRADGSGVVSFVHAPGDDDVPGPGWHGGISGTITWTCTS